MAIASNKSKNSCQIVSGAGRVLVATLLALAVGCGGEVPSNGPITAGPPLSMPSPELSPEDVVRLQMRALSDNWPEGRGVEQCFQFASPANRRITGPLDRFDAMVRSAPFRSLLDQRVTLIGRALVRDRRAAVLATFLDRNNQVRVFRFILSRQTEPEYAECWMTDGVIEVEAPPAKPPDKFAEFAAICRQATNHDDARV